jgi:hypothetical protein
MESVSSAASVGPFRGGDRGDIHVAVTGDIQSGGRRGVSKGAKYGRRPQAAVGLETAFGRFRGGRPQGVER